MKVLMYRSQGTDDMVVACVNIEEAVNCFRVDARKIIGGEDDGYKIAMWAEELTEEQMAAWPEYALLPPSIADKGATDAE
jgi:hypothetical protein